MINDIVNSELAELKQDLKKGDTIISEFSVSGKEIKHSKKVGEARIKFMKLISGLDLSAEEKTKACNLFGKKNY